MLSKIKEMNLHIDAFQCINLNNALDVATLELNSEQLRNPLVDKKKIGDQGLFLGLINGSACLLFFGGRTKFGCGGLAAKAPFGSSPALTI